ncbi:MAG: hypothetical protein Unbinned6224contig1003_44 [Prokaryotic dsDNA virus sp.]|nr:MAG: hypothetical protein Unbinned6224contig1003_44 [Prokaryotic dsDNA virus sp.]|tara:strand:- start:1352 stop:1570 length:219 start_codon:yes stop_codon:yes gene_type:complete
MKYLIKETLMTGGKILEAGSMVEAKDIPKKSLSWLLDQEIVVKVDKKMQEKILQDEKIDDVDTEFEEILEEE